MNLKFKKHWIWICALGLQMSSGPASWACDACLSDPNQSSDESELAVQVIACTKASSVVVGTVMSSRSYWLPDSSIIVTEYLVDAARLLKGEAPSTITVIAEGGTVDSLTLMVSDVVEMKVGNSYALTFTADVSQPGRFNGWRAIRTLDLTTSVDRQFVDDLAKGLTTTLEKRDK